MRPLDRHQHPVKKDPIDANSVLIPHRGIHRILVCRPNHRLGNTLLLTPLIAELEKHYRGAEIDILCESGIAREVFAKFFSMKNVFCLPRRGFKHPFSFLRLLLEIRRTRYDLVIDPSIGSGFGRAVTRFVRGRFKIGFSDRAGSPGLTHGAPVSVAMRHMAMRPVNLVRYLSDYRGSDHTEMPPLDIRLSEEERSLGRDAITELLEPAPNAGKPLVVGIFANATGAKRYPEAWWNEFIHAFLEQVPHAHMVELLPAHGQSMLGDAWPGYYSSDIRRMAAVMAGMDLIVSADCGVMHLAVASRVPTAGLFSVTDAAVYAPRGDGNLALTTQGVSARDAARHIVRAHPALTRQASAWSGPPASQRLP